MTREVYSSFWNEIKDSYMIGEHERVPVVRHDLFTEEWRAIGAILVKGFLDVAYFPSYLSKAFILYCLFDDVSPRQLIHSFMEFLAKEDAEVVKKALDVLDGDGDNLIFESEELLDVLEEFKCRTRVSKKNTYSIISELAQQELIQKPFLMTACWKESFTMLVQHHCLNSKENVLKLYEGLKPTPKKVISKLRCNPQNDPERDSLSFLKKFVKGLEDSRLKKFLKFVTGSDELIVDSIEVTFYKPLNNACRRPIAHTCAPCLELPSTYISLAEFREEFSSILNNNSWEMDIV